GDPDHLGWGRPWLSRRGVEGDERADPGIPVGQPQVGRPLVQHGAARRVYQRSDRLPGQTQLDRGGRVFGRTRGFENPRLLRIRVLTGYGPGRRLWSDQPTTMSAPMQ